MVVRCTIDKASSMLGCRSDFVARVSEANVKVKEASLHATLPPELKAVLLDVVAMVNFVKSNP